MTNNLVKDNLEFAYFLTRKFMVRYDLHGRIDRADLEQAAALGLVKAAGRFEPERMVSFKAYASMIIWGELQQECTRSIWVNVWAQKNGHRRLTFRRLCTDDEKMIDSREPGPDLIAEKREAIAIIEASVKDKADSVLVGWYYQDHQPLREIGMRLGISHQAVQVRLSRAVSRIKRAIGRRHA